MRTSLQNPGALNHVTFMMSAFGQPR